MSQYFSLSCHSPGRKWACSRFYSLFCRQSASSLSPLGERQSERHGGRERERCHFSHSAVMMRHINWLSLKRHTHTHEYKNNESSQHSSKLKLIPPSSFPHLHWESSFHLRANVKKKKKNPKTHQTHRGCHQMWHVHGPLNGRLKQNYYFIKPYWAEIESNWTVRWFSTQNVSSFTAINGIRLII